MRRAVQSSATIDLPATNRAITAVCFDAFGTLVRYNGQRVNPWETYSYHASKAAILYLTKRLAARLVQDHILVTAIAPGAFQSDMNKAARDHGDAVAKSIPVKRIGVPEDMAGAAIFLASKAGDYVVGDTIAVDGGLVHGDLKTSIDA